MIRPAILVGLLALGACAGTTPAQTAAVATADATGAESAASAISGIATTLSGIDHSGLTPAQVTALQTAVANLQGTAATLAATPGQPAAVVSAAAQATTTLQTVQAFLPLVAQLLPLLTLVQDPVVDRHDLLHYIADAPAPTAHLTDAQAKQLKAQIAALIAAKAKAAAAASKSGT